MYHFSDHGDARGREFVFAFPTQSKPPRDYAPSLLITSASKTNTSIEIIFPKLRHEENIVKQVLPGQLIVVDLPPEVMSDPSSHYQFGTIIVQADGYIYVVANAYTESGPNLASFNVIPTSAIGTEYVIIDWPYSANYFLAEFVITSLHDQTHIKYILTSTPTAPGRPKEGLIQIQQFETIQFQVNINTGVSFSGSQIWSDKPITVVAGCECAVVPLAVTGSCDYVAANLIPFAKWGLLHSLAPFKGQERSGYVIRIAAARNDTLITIGKSAGQVLLQAGGIHEERIRIQNVVTIVGNKPISVVQFALSQRDGIGDPLMVIVPPFKQYVNGIISFIVPDSSVYRIDVDYLTVFTLCETIDGLLFDGKPLNGSWKQISDDDVIMCAAQATITSINSMHDISHVTSDAPMTAMLYGFGKKSNAASYGYSLGFGLENITCVLFDDETNSTKEELCQQAGPGKLIF